jgi:hypothetical protein
MPMKTGSCPLTESKPQDPKPSEHHLMSSYFGLPLRSWPSLPPPSRASSSSSSGCSSSSGSEGSAASLSGSIDPPRFGRAERIGGTHLLRFGGSADLPIGPEAAFLWCATSGWGARVALAAASGNRCPARASLSSPSPTDRGMVEARPGPGARGHRAGRVRHRRRATVATNELDNAEWPSTGEKAARGRQFAAESEGENETAPAILQRIHRHHERESEHSEGRDHGGSVDHATCVPA